jgi:hypothetical protein
MVRPRGRETIVFGWDGEWREIDLAKANLDKLTKLRRPYLEKSRPADRKRLSTMPNGASQGCA